MSNLKKNHIVVIVVAIIALVTTVIMPILFVDVSGDDKTITTKKEIVPMALEDSKDVFVDIIGEDVYYRFFIKNDNGENQFVNIPARMAEMYKIDDDEISYCQKINTFKTTKVRRWGKVVDEVIDNSPYSTVYKVYVARDAVDVFVPTISTFTPRHLPKKTELF